MNKYESQQPVAASLGPEIVSLPARRYRADNVVHQPGPCQNARVRPFDVCMFSMAPKALSLQQPSELH